MTLVVLIGLVTAARLASAQPALEYFDCDVEDVPSFTAALGNVYEATRGSDGPGIFIDQWLWNGQDTSTHRVIVQHSSFNAMEAWRSRFVGNGPALAALESLTNVSDCINEGLSVFIGAWGNLQAQATYFAVYAIAAADGAAYVDALTELAEAQAATAPGQVILFENRAGQHGVSHIVAIGAPTLAGLNSFLGTLFASDDFEDFTDDVGASRRVVSASQARRVQVWAVPPPN